MTIHIQEIIIIYVRKGAAGINKYNKGNEFSNSASELCNLFLVHLPSILCFDSFMQPQLLADEGLRRQGPRF